MKSRASGMVCACDKEEAIMATTGAVTTSTTAARNAVPLEHGEQHYF